MSALAKTAAITLLTGIPGSGKSLRVVQYMKQAVEAGEVLFVCNFDGKLHLPHIKFEDAREWQDIPPGSVLVVDEAQDFFRARRSGEPPAYITAMERIRKLGVRLVLTTQQPDYLDTHLRGLVGLHEHLLREQGKESSRIYRSNEVMDNVRSKRARTAHDSEVWAFPRELYGLYESAQVHTVKPAMRAKTKRGLVIAALAIAGVSFVVFKVGSKAVDQAPAQDARASEPSARSSASDGPGRERSSLREKVSAKERHEPDSIEEYFANLRPRDAALPWSAPIYDDRPAQAEPRVFCMQGGAGVDADGNYKPAGFTCLTEQGTRVVMPDANAALIARHGEAYNPFRQPMEDKASQSQLSALVPEQADRGERSASQVMGAAGPTASRPMVDRSYGTITRPSL